MRFVVTQWFSDENIDLSYLSTHVDSENDKKVNTMPLEDNITFVNFPIKSEHEKKSNQMKISNAHEKNLEVSKQLKNDFERSEREKSNNTEQLQQSKNSAESKKLKKCNPCDFKTKKTSNLKRHILRKHGAECVKEVKSNCGSCLCLECGYTCLRIRDLQYHLIYLHNHNLRFETKLFETYEGKILSFFLILKPFINYLPYAHDIRNTS